MGKAGRPPALYTHTIDGERRSLTLTQWASVLDVQESSIRRAAHRAGCSVNDEIAVQIARRAALAPTAPQTPQATSGAAASPIGDALARVQSLLSANVAGSQRAARRVVECAERYALAVEQAQAHRLLVFVGAATGEEPTAQTAALTLYDALLGVPELAALLTQPAPKAAPKATVTTPIVSLPMAPETPAAEPEPAQPDPYEVVVTRKPDASAIAQPTASEPAATNYPALAAASRRNPLLIVGGIPLPDKLKLLEQLGIHAQWIEVNRTGGRLVESAIQRVKKTSVCAVVVPHGFIGHRDGNRMRDAARRGVVPFESPARMGDADFARTLSSLDAHFAKQAS